MSMSQEIPIPDNTAPANFPIVIPGLGSELITLAIEKINLGSARPKEILVCIPEMETHREQDLLYDNVRLVPTPVCDQVAQRVFDFSQARPSLVM
ncbi:hypothetical protein DLREEDagrD3_22390 [Denitratisoma sp. agr-D3]